MQEAITNPDLAAMYARCEGFPGDTTLYGAVADELDSLGWAKLAHAFRWMSRRAMWPHKREFYGTRYGAKGRAVQARHRWAWYRHSAQARYLFPKPTGASHLPSLLMPMCEQRLFQTHQQAVMFLADRLADLAAVHSVEEPQPPGLSVDVHAVTASGSTIRVPPEVLAEATIYPGTPLIDLPELTGEAS